MIYSKFIAFSALECRVLRGFYRKWVVVHGALIFWVCGQRSQWLQMWEIFLVCSDKAICSESVELVHVVLVVLLFFKSKNCTVKTKKQMKLNLLPTFSYKFSTISVLLICSENNICNICNHEGAMLGEPPHRCKAGLASGLLRLGLKCLKCFDIGATKGLCW